MSTKIYFDISDEIIAAINENDLTIKKIIEGEGINADFDYGLLPTNKDEPERTKALVEIAILVAASSGAIMAIAYAISNTLRTIYNKPHLVSIQENEELRDARGNVLLNRNGDPIFKAVKKITLIESRKNKVNDIFEFKVGLKDGIVIKLESGEGEKSNN
jgi:hypothetical protein